MLVSYFVDKALATQAKDKQKKGMAAQCTENHNINKVLATNLATLCNDRLVKGSQSPWLHVNKVSKYW